MDRIAPTRRPEGPRAGTQRWRDLMFVHWEVPAEVLRPLLPARLSLDTFEGRAFVGLVPFAMFDVRPRWLPRFMQQDFLETNLRTYVHLDGQDPGVWFFSLEAASWTAVHAARLGWGLPYHHARMQRHREDETWHYETVRRRCGAHLRTRWTPGELLGPSTPGTVEHFLLERYVLYAERRGRLYRGRIHHPPYEARATTLHELHESIAAAAGLPGYAAPPAFVHCCDGVDVELFAITAV